MYEKDDENFGLIGKSSGIAQVIDDIKAFSKYDFPVYILGETGTGKELAARAIHENSSRRAGNFSAINCAAIPEGLFESEFFGYERGSFTGATQYGKKGILQNSDKGTLFLDEILSMNRNMQEKLLRVLDGYGYRKIGGKEDYKADIRLIVASNRPLESHLNNEIDEAFFYRIDTLRIRIPPLRERGTDSVILAEYFLSEFNRSYDHKTELDDSALEFIQRYHWPGNVRQLKAKTMSAAIKAVTNNREVITRKDYESGLNGLVNIRGGGYDYGPVHGIVDMAEAGVPLKDLSREFRRRIVNYMCLRYDEGTAADMMDISEKDLRGIRKLRP